MGFQLLPIDIGYYDHHELLPVEAEVASIAESLMPFGATTEPWPVPMEKRDHEAVTDRLKSWASNEQRQPGVLYWAGHGWSNVTEAALAHKASEGFGRERGISYASFATYVARRQLPPMPDTPWCIVVIDTCQSRRFVQLVISQLLRDQPGVGNVLWIGVSGEGATHLGDFSAALHRTLTLTYGNVTEISLAALAGELKRVLEGALVLPGDLSSDALLRRDEPPATGVSLDARPELEAAFAVLPEDERSYFLHDGDRAELGEATWLIDGRERERRSIVAWLNRPKSRMLIVTGRAGSGKSALLGEVLINTWPGLRRAMVERGLVFDLPAARRPPERAFQATLRLTGASAGDVIDRIGAVLEWDRPPSSATQRERLAALEAAAGASSGVTILADSLDEAQQPLSVARVLRSLANAGVRVLVGTRSSTLEGPDRPDPQSEDIVDALAGRSGERTAKVLPLARSPAALAKFIARSLEGSVSAPTVRLLQRSAQLHDREFLFASLAVHEILARAEEPAGDGPGLEELLAGSHRDLFAHAVDRIAALAPTNGAVLEALGLAQGRGIPIRDGVLGALAGALGDGQDVAMEALDALLADASPYVMIDVEGEQTVFRLAHRTYSEHYLSRDTASSGEASHQGARERHMRIVTRLVDLAESAPGGVNPYVARHLTGHIASAEPGAWEMLAEHPRLLDRLSPQAVTNDALRTTFGAGEMPPEIGGVIAMQHLLKSSRLRDREGIRQVGMARCAGRRSFGGDPAAGPSSSTWTVRSAVLRPHPVHLTLDSAGPVRCLCALPPTGSTSQNLATAGANGTIRIWDPLTGSLEGELPIGRPARAMVSFKDSDGATLIVTDGDRCTACVWDLTSGEMTASFTLHTGAILALATCTLAGATAIASGGEDETVRLWNPLTGEQLEELSGHGDWVTALGTWEQGTRLASGSADGKVLVWDLGSPADLTPGAGPPERRTPVRTMPGAGPVRAIAPYKAADERTGLAVAGPDRAIRLWDPLAGEPLGEVSGLASPVRSLATVAIGEGSARIAGGGADGSIRLWDPLIAGATDAVHEGASDRVRAVAGWESRPDRVATAGEDGLVRLWNPERGTQLGDPLSTHVGPVHALLAYRNAQERCRLASGGQDERVLIWDPERPAAKPTELLGHTRPIHAITSFSQGGLVRLASGDEDGTIHIWDTDTALAVGDPLGDGSGWVRGLAAYRGGRHAIHLAAVGADTDVRIWKSDDPGPPELLRGHTNWVQCVCSLPAPRGVPRIATGGDDATVRIWNPAARPSDREIAVLEGHEAPVHALAAYREPFKKRSWRLASASDDGTVRIWDPATGLEIQRLTLGIAARAVHPVAGGLLIGTDEGHLLVNLPAVSHGV